MRQRKSHATTESHPGASASKSKHESQKRDLQLSTSLSDAVLAAACFYLVFIFMGKPQSFDLELLYEVAVRGGLAFYTGLAFLLIGTAASFGVLRFACVPLTVGPHDFFTNLAAFLAAPFLGLCAFAWVRGLDEHGLALGASLLAFNYVLFHWVMNMKQIYTLVAGGLAMALVLYLGVLHINGDAGQVGVLLVCGSLLYVLAGVVVGTNGTYFGLIPRVDVFHYALAVANLAIGLGLAPLAGVSH